MNGGVLIMKKYLKEILILLIQLFMFYILSEPSAYAEKEVGSRL